MHREGQSSESELQALGARNEEMAGEHPGPMVGLAFGRCHRAAVRARPEAWQRRVVYSWEARKVSKSRSSSCERMRLRAARVWPCPLWRKRMSSVTPAVMAVVGPPLQAEIPEKRVMSAPQAPRARRSASPNEGPISGGRRRWGCGAVRSQGGGRAGGSAGSEPPDWRVSCPARRWLVRSGRA